MSLHDGILIHKGVAVPAVDKHAGMSAFIRWLKLHMDVVLIGHNVKHFDAVHLLRVAHECDMLDQLQEEVLGFVDTLPFFEYCI